MTTRTIPAEQISTAGTLAAFMKSLPPSTPIDLGGGDMRLEHDGKAEPNVAISVTLMMPKPKPKPKAKRGKK